MHYGISVCVGTLASRSVIMTIVNYCISITITSISITVGVCVDPVHWLVCQSPLP